ncbi:tail fiber assembly protein [Erwinia sp. AnSW2-5]|uniref:tail fiber assembly protein n=1 Tax=Erwinia sp. AnSW2-5 TaxID=3367692 RepID=UPI00385B12B3
MEYITLNEQGFADVSGWINCHVVNYDGEYIGQRDEYISATTGLPAGAYLDKPPKAKKGMAIVRKGGEWAFEEDHRGEVIFSTKDQSSKIVETIGSAPDGYTLIKPSSIYESWSGSEWVLDEAAKEEGEKNDAENNKSKLIEEANNYINNKQWPSKLALNRISDEDKKLFIEWLDYIDNLNDIDISSPSWPEKP